MKNSRLSQSRWHDKIMSSLGVEPARAHRDYSWMPLQTRRDNAAELLASGWDYDYLQRWYAVQLSPNDFKPDQMTADERVTVVDVFAARGLSREKLSTYFGIQKEAA